MTVIHEDSVSGKIFFLHHEAYRKRKMERLTIHLKFNMLTAEKGKKRTTAGSEQGEFLLSQGRAGNQGPAGASSLIIRHHQSTTLLCYERETTGQELHIWYLFFSSHVTMFSDEDEDEEERRMIKWKLSGSTEIYLEASLSIFCCFLIQVMDHHQLQPHRSLSDRG